MSATLEPVEVSAPGNLPNGWRAVTLEDIVADGGAFVDGDWVESKDQDPEGDVRLIQLADVGDGAYRDRSERFLTSAKADELGCTFLEPGDLLVARMPDPLGRACIFPGDKKRAVTVVDIAVVRPRNPDVNARWLMYCINAPRFRRAVASLQSGSTRQRISRKNLAKIVFQLPPMGGQSKTVAEIEKQFSRLDEAIATLKGAQARLKHYRDAVLSSAVSGGMTTGCAPPPASPRPDMAPDTPLPLGWTWVAASNVCEVIASGSTPRPDEMTPGVGEVPFIKVYNLTFDGSLDFTIRPTFIDRAIHADKLRRSRCRPGDVLTNIVGPPLGKVSIVSDQFPEWNINQAIVTFRAGPLISNRLLAYWLMSPPIQRRLARTAKATAGQFKVQVSTCRKLVLPLPPVSEQHEIVAELDRRLSNIREIEAEVDRSLKRGPVLRQAILASSLSHR